MKYETLLVTKLSSSLLITIHRPNHNNSINSQLLKDLHNLLDDAEADTNCRFIVLQGYKGVFCTGADFQELAEYESIEMPTAKQEDNLSASYMFLLKRLTLTPKIIICLLDGQVVAGGVGIVAASDLVLSTINTQFSLSEVLWGLLPACVTPFLIRRVGFQKAYYMTLTTNVLMATEAKSIGLIDELTENPSDSLNRIHLRLGRIHQETIKDLKEYFRKMWIITDEMEAIAVREITRLSCKPQVKANLANFIKYKQFPWEHTVKP